MKLTLKQKREIVERFKAGQNQAEICDAIPTDAHICGGLVREESPVLEVLRDYMNGKFKLTHKQKGRTG